MRPVVIRLFLVNCSGVNMMSGDDWLLRFVSDQTKPVPQFQADFFVAHFVHNLGVAHLLRGRSGRVLADIVHAYAIQ